MCGSALLLARAGGPSRWTQPGDVLTRQHGQRAHHDQHLASGVEPQWATGTRALKRVPPRLAISRVTGSAPAIAAPSACQFGCAEHPLKSWHVYGTGSWWSAALHGSRRTQQLDRDSAFPLVRASSRVLPLPENISALPPSRAVRSRGDAIGPCPAFPQVRARFAWYPRPDSNRRYRLERAMPVRRVRAGQRLFGPLHFRDFGTHMAWLDSMTQQLVRAAGREGQGPAIPAAPGALHLVQRSSARPMLSPENMRYGQGF